MVRKPWPGHLLSGVLSAYWLGSLLWFLFRWGGPAVKTLVADWLFLPLGLLVGLAVWVTAGQASDPRHRSAWRLLALGNGMLAVANAGWFYYEHILGRFPFPSWADLGYFLAYPFFIAGLMALRTGGMPPAERRSLQLDVAIVMVAGTVAAYYGMVVPALALRLDPWSTALSLAYPVCDLVLLIGLATLTMGGSEAPSLRSYRVLSLAFMLWLVADVIYAHGFMLSTYESGDWVDFISMTGSLLVVWSAWVQRWEMGQARSAAGASATDHARATVMPYFGPICANGLLLLALVEMRGASQIPLLVGLGLIAGLVVLRHFASIRENNRLIQETRALAAKVQRSETRFRSLLQNSSDVVMTLSPKGRIAYLSPSAERTFGYQPSELRGRSCLGLVHPDDLPAIAASLADTGTEGVIECRVRHAAGGWRWTEARTSRFVRDSGMRGVVLNIRDITERKELEERLLRMAYHDPLTQLANRECFRKRASEALAAAADPGRVAVLFLDLDGFKRINDSFGHEMGDRLLQWLGDRIRQAVASDGLVARFGGDEFAVLIERADLISPAQVAERIGACLQEPFDLRGRPLHCRVSTGIASGSEGGSVDDMLREADAAMYAAKAARDGGYATYSPEMHVQALRRLELETDLRRAIGRGELVLHYQPIVDLQNRRISGLEALVRWAHPERGLLGPGEFIQLAEEAGLMQPISLWVLREACTQFADWRRRYPSLRDLTMNVNLSAVDLRRPEICDEVEQVLVETGIPPEALTLEITESLLVERTEVMTQRLQSLRRMGVRLAIDDFGTGYSSLSYLKDFPVDMIKIDRSFIRELAGNQTEAAMVRGILEMSRALKLQTVAEGVEDAGQLAALTGMPCDYGQGFYFARPADAGRVTALLQDVCATAAQQRAATTAVAPVRR